MSEYPSKSDKSSSDPLTLTGYHRKGLRIVFIGTEVATYALLFSGWLLLIVSISMPIFQLVDYLSKNYKNTDVIEEVCDITSLVEGENKENKGEILIHTSELPKEPSDDEEDICLMDVLYKFYKTNFTVSRILKFADQILIAITILIISSLLLGVSQKAKKIPINEFGRIIEAVRDTIKDIDTSILSMIVITLSVSFLVVILGNKPKNIFYGVNFGFLILCIGFYTYVTHIAHNTKNNNKC